MNRRSERRYRIEWLLLGSVLAILGAYLGLSLYDDRNELEARERDRLQVQARVIDENLVRQLEGVNLALAGMRGELHEREGKTSWPEASQRLKILSHATPGVRTLLVLDAEGEIRASNRPELIGQNLGERDYFRTPREHADPAMLYVSPPFKTVLGVFSINVTRLLAAPGGKFAGVVSATLDPEYFNTLLRSVLFAPDMRAVLAHGDGSAFLFMPANPQRAGTNLATPGTFFSRHRDSGQTVTLLTGASVFTGAGRIMATRTVKRAALQMDKPLVIQVSRELSAIYAPWRKAWMLHGSIYGTAAVAAILGLYLIHRRRRSFERLAAAFEQQRSDGAERLRLATEAAGLGVWEFDPATKRLNWDQATFALHGIDPAIVTSKYQAWRDSVFPEDLAQADAALEESISTGRQSEATYRVRRSDGEVRVIRSLARTYLDLGGRPFKTVGVCEDVTERKRAETELRDAEKRFRSIVESVSLIGVILDRSGNILVCNDYLLGLTGWARDEVLNRNWFELFLPPGIRDRVEQRVFLDGLAAGEIASHFRNEIVTRRGERLLVEWNNILLRGVDGSVNGVASLGQDITAREQAQARHAQLEAQLRESQKMEALGTLAGGVAHDFNNIIAAIIGNVELARQDVGPSHPATESLEEIRKASRRAKDLVQQILAFGRRQVLERKVIALAPVVEESVRLLRATLPAGVALNVECAAGAPAVLADATQIQQVVLNLCGNAWHAVQGQERPGVIEIRLAAQESPSGRRTCLTVRDNGRGMDAAVRERIFEPFFTTKPVGEGTGLGLSVVHGIVQEHEASIEVESVPGAGSAFHVCFPAAPPAVSAQSAHPATAASPREQGQHVLYVDDDEAIVFLTKRMLERQGYRVSAFTDPGAALAAVRALPHEFDLVVTDYNMPGMSGLEVARALREIRADLPVALASGFITEELRASAPAAGVRELVFKPDTVDALCETVARLASTLHESARPGRAQAHVE